MFEGCLLVLGQLTEKDADRMLPMLDAERGKLPKELGVFFSPVAEAKWSLLGSQIPVILTLGHHL